MTFAALAPQVINSPPLLRRQWPDTLVPPSDNVGGILGFGGSNKFWEQIRNLRSYTDSTADRFSEQHVGSTGWEYAFTIIYGGGQFYYTAPHTSRDYEKVSTTHRLSVKTVPGADGKSVTDTFILDGKSLGSRTFRGDEEIEQRNIEIRQHKFGLGFFAHFHSHPQQQVGGRPGRIFGFFSDTDMSSFISGSMALTGLVTNRLWLLGKTAEFMDLAKSGQLLDLNKDMIAVAQAELDNSETLLEVASQNLSKYELAAYTAEFGKTLTRIA